MQCITTAKQSNLTRNETKKMAHGSQLVSDNVLSQRTHLIKLAHCGEIKKMANDSLIVRAKDNLKLSLGLYSSMKGILSNHNSS